MSFVNHLGCSRISTPLDPGDVYVQMEFKENKEISQAHFFNSDGQCIESNDNIEYMVWDFGGEYASMEFKKVRLDGLNLGENFRVQIDEQGRVSKIIGVAFRYFKRSVNSFPIHEQLPKQKMLIVKAEDYTSDFDARLMGVLKGCVLTSLRNKVPNVVGCKFLPSPKLL